MQQYVPRQRVTIRRAENNHQPEYVSQDVINIQTHKAYGVPLGKFNITFPFAAKLDGLRYDQLLKPNDIVLVELDGGYGGGFVPVMLGLVDEAMRVKRLDGEGRPLRTSEIRCSDFGKIFIRHHCQWYLAPSPAHIGSEEALTEVVYGAKLRAGGTPAKIAKDIIEAEVFGIMPWTKDFISTDRITTEDNWYRTKVILSYQEPVWEALRSVSNRPYNILHADTLENKQFGVILEKCPFDENGRLALQAPRTLHFIDPEDIITEELGRNDLDRITYLYQKVDIGIFGEPTGQKLLYIKGDAIKYEEADIQKYGFIPWMPGSNFVPFPKSKGREVSPLLADYKNSADRPVQERTALMWEWYRRNAEYESGLLTMHGRPDIRCGDGVLCKEMNYQYLVEQVAHKWSFGDKPTCITSLHVTRGQPNG
jgi:hypothetical protein